MKASPALFTICCWGPRVILSLFFYLSCLRFSAPDTQPSVYLSVQALFTPIVVLITLSLHPFSFITLPKGIDPDIRRKCRERKSYYSIFKNDETIELIYWYKQYGILYLPLRLWNNSNIQIREAFIKNQSSLPPIFRQFISSTPFFW